MIIATAGHVDHGKTALVRALTGVDTDRLAEEKRRGMTIDLGFAYQTLPDGRTLGFVDVPGHQRFVHTMLAGATGVDFVLLVVAADDGPMPQTAEHLAILNLLGLNRGACVITKCDKASPARVADVSKAISNMLSVTGLAGAPVFPTSTLEGEGIADVQAFLLAAAQEHQERHSEGTFRFTIDRAFSVVGSGLVVTGTVMSGRIGVGDQLALAPSGQSVRVRGIHAQSTSLDEGKAGQRLGINIAGAGLDADLVSRGDVLVMADRCQPTLRLDAEVTVLESEIRHFGQRANVHFHIGAADIPAQVQVLESDPIKPGEAGLVHVVLRHPISTVCGDRFVLRDRSASRTIGGGRVINPVAPKLRVRSADRLKQLRAMALGDPHAALAALLDGGESIVDVNVFKRAWNLQDPTMAGLSDSIDAEHAGAVDARVLIARARWREMITDILKIVEAWHAQNPSAIGISIGQLQQRIVPQITSEQFRDVLRAAVDKGTVKVTGAHVVCAGFQAALPVEDAALWQRIRPLLMANKIISPRVVEMAEQIQVPHQTVTQALTAAARMGFVHPVAANRFYLPSGMRQLAEITHSLGEDFDVKAFRDAAGLGRNLAIEVLEYFDSCAFTRRNGNTRMIIGDAAAIFPDAENIANDTDTPMDTPTTAG